PKEQNKQRYPPATVSHAFRPSSITNDMRMRRTIGKFHTFTLSKVWKVLFYRIIFFRDAWCLGIYLAIILACILLVLEVTNYLTPTFRHPRIILCGCIGRTDSTRRLR